MGQLEKCECGETFESNDKFCLVCGRPRTERNKNTSSLTTKKEINLENCPYCGHEMVYGYISSATETLWQESRVPPNNAIGDIFDSNLNNNSVSINNFSAKKCIYCKLIVIPF